ncbi:MAG: CBS domain-containing protein [Pirellulales bacterium]|nr:CBS domain-containing protein [Pirellulales bacterium]
MYSEFAVPGPLNEIKVQVDASEKPETTVRQFLGWFGYERRGWRVVNHIRRVLIHLDLRTVPDFEGEYIDSPIKFVPADPVTEPAGMDATVDSTTTTQPPDSADSMQEVPALSAPLTAQLAAPAHRISRLKSANTPPVSVPPDATVRKAVTIMMQHDYSQLPVMQSNQEVKGLISWRSLGARLAVGQTCEYVRDCMDKHREIHSDASLFDAISIISEQECVLVRALNKTICGIVTAYDIGAQFQQLTEPFLLLGDIENHIRYLIANFFTLEDIRQAKDANDEQREIEDVSDLTFGEYVRLLQNKESWTKLNMEIDRKIFTEWLDKVREIRNEVTHFDPDPIEPTNLRLLKDFARFLQELEQIGALGTRNGDKADRSDKRAMTNAFSGGLEGVEQDV